TFGEMREAAEKLTAEDVYLFADDDTQGWNVLPWIWSAGGDITDEDVTTSTGYINSAASVEGVQLLVDLYQQGAVPELLLGSQGGTPTSDGLPSGESATIPDGPGMYPGMERASVDLECRWRHHGRGRDDQYGIHQQRSLCRRCAAAGGSVPAGCGARAAPRLPGRDAHLGRPALRPVRDHSRRAMDVPDLRDPVSRFRPADRARACWRRWQHLGRRR